VEVVLSRPAHRWTPLEQVRFALEHGEPYGAPDETFHYSDTGYVLAGQIIEQVTGLPLAAALRSLLGFGRLGLETTWLESVEPAPAGASPRAHQYIGDLDTYDFDPSFDLFGGGGLVSTTADLARFWRALFAGEVYEQPATLAEMLTVWSESAAAAGLFRIDVDGHTGWQHGGFWGSEVVHVPDLDLTIALSVGQAEGAAAGEVTEHLLAGLGSVLELR
jgi:D-alanyl-D-alanine carboxypeptidase